MTISAVSRRLGWRTSLAAAAVLALVLASCSYYGQAIRGGLEIVCRRRPIARLLRDPTLEAGLRERLEAVERMRRFAVDELHLPDNASYRSYADLGRPYVSWTVTAAPALSLEPRTWCFPVAGCVSYRGYFSPEDAERFAAGLAAEGFDVDVGGVRAFSTLGWLADPVLNTFLDLPEADLAGLIFHELAHQVVYAKGDTVFNESFATVVEREGARRWLLAWGREEEWARALAARRREEEVGRLLSAARGELAALYGSPLEAAEKRRRKAEILAAARERYVRLADGWRRESPAGVFYDAWFDDGLNNARLASWGAYHQRVPELEALLAREGGDLARFYRATRSLIGRSHRQRER